MTWVSHQMPDPSFGEDLHVSSKRTELNFRRYRYFVSSGACRFRTSLSECWGVKSTSPSTTPVCVRVTVYATEYYIYPECMQRNIIYTQMSKALKTMTIDFIVLVHRVLEIF